MSRELVLRLPASAEPELVRDPQRLRVEAARALGLGEAELGAVRLRRLSFDARPRERVWRVVLDVWAPGEEVPPEPRTTPAPLERPRAAAPRVLVIGAGPAGLFCALDLLRAGLNVSLVERGGDVRARRVGLARLNRGQGVDPDSNYCFGEGGAGTFSDGKLYTRSGDRHAVRALLEELVAHGAPPEILASWRPHVGSNRLPRVVTALRETLLAGGAQLRFGVRAEELVVESVQGGAPRVVGATLHSLEAGGEERLAAQAVVLATGHSALDSLQLAARAGAQLEPKGFAVGLRAEHPQALVDARQYGGLREVCELPAAFYELRARAQERGVYSFCMCPGGFIVPATTDAARVVVNGMSLSRRDSPFANSGVVVALEPEDWCGERGRAFGFDALLRAAGGRRGDFLSQSADGTLPASPEQDPLFGVRIQHALEVLAARAGGGGGRAPAQRVDQFVEGAGAADVLATSYRPGLTPRALAGLLPRGVAQRLAAGLADFERHLPGIVSEKGQLVGVESRTSSPVRIARSPQTLVARGLDGLYPCGEGAGFAGGIVSAALDGRRVAAALADVLA